MLALLLGVVVLIAGCTSNSIQKMPASDRPSFTPKSVNQYYYFTEAQIQRQKGNLDKAIGLLQKAIEIDPDSLYLKREIATVYLQNKEDENAIGVLEDILKNNPGDIKSLILYGGINQVRKDYTLKPKN
jgi:predicted Zn-dependent protease